MTTEGEVHRMNAVVVYSSRFGTTEKIARSLEKGLREANAQTTCTDVQGLVPESLKSFDLVCIGGPTEVLSASKPMKDFIKSIKEVSLGGKFGFAFDTKYDSRISGSAAKYIEHALDDAGVRMITRRESAIVSSKKEGGKLVGAVLKDGEEKRFEELGARIGATTAKAMAKIPRND